MQREESVTLANDLKNKIHAHLRTGYGLRHSVASLESSQIISFNAVADSLTDGLANKCSMESISTGIADRIASMESLMVDLKRFIFSKKKEVVERKADPEPDIITKLEWYQNTLPGLLAAYEDREGSVTIAGQYSPVFSDASNLVKKLQKDNSEYKSIFTAAMAKVKKWEVYLSKVENDLKGFRGSNDRVEEFKTALAKLVKGQPDSYLPSFKQPAHDFLGYVNMSFTDDEGFIFESPAPAASAIDVELPSKKFITDLVKAVNDTLALCLLAEDATLDRVLSEDPTDPPTRGYLGLTREIDELVNQAMFYHPVYEENNTYALENINHRLTYLLSALIHYLMKVLK
jgi:hypothetical protein